MEDQVLNVSGIVLGLLGGLALFLYGMEHLTDALKIVAGSKMKNLLASLTTNRLKAVATGSVVTATIQSSSVTTVLLVGFVSAGLMSLEQSIGVIMGASIGTTLTAQIIAFKVTHLALVAVVVGFLMHFMSKRETVKQYGMMVLGLGLIFFGMDLMGDATNPLRTHEPFIQLMQSMDQPMLAILASAAFTALVQSSSATTGVIIVLASQGFVSLQAGVALVLGANIGTCVTALLASIGKPREAVRTALIHVTFNVVGVVLWYGFIPALAAFVTMISPSAETLSGVARAAAETPRQIANAHTTFNVANTLIFIWFTPQFARFVRFLVPERPEGAEDGARTRFLDEELMDAPALALDRVRLELGRIADRVVELIQRASPRLMGATPIELREIQDMDDEIDALYASVVSYLGRLSRSGMRLRESEKLQDYISVANYFEAMADIVETNVTDVATDVHRDDLVLSEETRLRLTELWHRVVWAVERSAQAVYANDIDAATEVINAKAEINESMEELQGRLLERLTADAPHRTDTFKAESTYVESLRRIYYFAKRIAKVIANVGVEGAPPPLPALEWPELERASQQAEQVATREP